MGISGIRAAFQNTRNYVVPGKSDAMSLNGEEKARRFSKKKWNKPWDGEMKLQMKIRE